MTPPLTTSSCRRIAPALVAAIAALGLTLAMPALAERADQGKPLVLEADNASYDDVKQIYTLTGNVVLTKGTMVLKSDAAELRTDPEGYQYAIATAKPGRQAYIRQKRDGVDEYIDGWGDRIEYDGKSEINKLIGHARAARVSGVGAKIIDEIRGAVITYDSRNEFYTATGGDSNTAAGNSSGRVRAVLSPRSDASAPAAAGAPLNLKPSDTPAKP
ncbi:lipopolysaccharide transport periplasmic protein LptA [Cupriavidus pauculus]|uniref:lipopolysaccharide transport periplasmic protein LptA n=1 Tax=Cupriavidus pauculus TaxID=82633 RepID=UPI001246EF5D|nr:lipopolysaccharide transport periplasmic protein LptA [Cupriavidus pauculus]KAB0603289.1 lipopolysaccharide transport periplasmic protein LptA [Cupriavidus pauculus]MCM3604458.1 lipopolysaccharide transport periplasmic protein LptA [Cupriavidus pauculus]UAK98512.1 lipopolysaccharide transport periplasmic protein LptA [Cupriavidus pauculus]